MLPMYKKLIKRIKPKKKKCGVPAVTVAVNATSTTRTPDGLKEAADKVEAGAGEAAGEDGEKPPEGAGTAAAATGELPRGGSGLQVGVGGLLHQPVPDLDLPGAGGAGAGGGGGGEEAVGAGGGWRGSEDVAEADVAGVRVRPPPVI